MKKICLITGCSTGIGKSMALQLAKRGYTVYAGVRNIDSLTAQASQSLVPVRLDVNDQHDIDRVIDTITKQSGQLDLLINNAGFGAMGPVAEVPIEQIKSQFSTNVFAPIALTQAALPLLIKSSHAQVVNIGSVAGVFTIPFSGVYGASKAALHAITDVLRMELKPFNIHVMTVYPGGVASAFGDTATQKLQDTLKVGSLYKSCIQAITNRAKLSSDSPTTPDMFAQTLIAALHKRNPPASIFIGHGSSLLKLAKAILPSRLRERILRKTYSLSQLGQ
jgi:short-subunit dehydrogenase